MSEGISPNARRWLDTIAFAEGTWGGSGPRYDITFGYQPIKDLSKHPDRVVKSGGYASAAAGAYQFMPSTWARAQKALGLKDFGPTSQDLAALQLLRWRGVDPDKDPLTRENVAKVAGEWASLPTMAGKSAYGQPVKSFETLEKFAESQGARAASGTSTESARDKTADEETKVLSQLLLSKFIDLLSNRNKSGLGAGLASPELPTYEEEGDASARELNILLNTYEKGKQQDQYQQALEQQKADELTRNLAAAEAAKNQLFAQAVGAFAAPKSVI